MIHKLPDTLLDILDLSTVDGLPSHIRKSTNGLLFKKEREENKAAQEYLATKYARFLLPESLRIPEILGIFANHLVLRYYSSGQLNKKSKEEVYQAADYLIEMHKVELTAKLKELLIRNHYCHYYGNH